MAGQPYGRNHVFRDHVRLVANNHRLQGHVVKSMANQRRQTVAGTFSVLNLISFLRVRMQINIRPKLHDKNVVLCIIMILRVITFENRIANENENDRYSLEN